MLKVRGPLVKFSHFTPEQKKRGVICSSAGNHAQGVALAAAFHKTRAVVVMAMKACNPNCINDGLRVKRVGEHTFSVVKRFVEDIVTLPDSDIFDAMVWIMSHCKVVAEGAAAAPVAALLHGLVKVPAGSKVVCVLSGGNVDLDKIRGLTWN